MCNGLAGYAVTENNSRGRVHREPEHPYRRGFERDRDRIIHCSAFRRLEGKTQVFTPGLDDYYRSRLTHTIEVAQIGRTIARVLGLNESLTEAICLAHDLGHCPFGHAGEKVLDELTARIGGFEHNRQSLRIVELLEHPYPNFAGLNLMYETRLGLARHTTPYDKSDVATFEELNCSLEGQVASIADRIAVSSHDLEDGMRARIIHEQDLEGLELYDQARKKINANAIQDRTVRRTRTAKAIIDTLVSDCIETSRAALAQAKIKTVEDVYAREDNLILLSGQSEARLAELERFLQSRFYKDRLVLEVAEKVNQWLGELFELLCRNPEYMPGYFRRLADRHGLERTVCDYIAGMTDRFCLQTLKRLGGKATLGPLSNQWTESKD